MVGEIGNWPHGRQPAKADWRLTALMVAFFVWAIISVIFGTDEDPKLLPQVAGCYLNHQHRVAIIVDRRSILRAQGLTIPVTVHDLKWGGARLLPARRVAYDADNNRIEAAAGDPLFIDSDRFFGSLTVVSGADTPILEFVRVPCPGLSKAATLS